MAKKNKRNNSPFVFSTNPDFVPPSSDNEDQESLDPSEQDLRVHIDRKQRRGKEVTLVTGFIGSDEEMKKLGKMLKSKCGVGGAVKNGEIMIQGNHRPKVIELLKKEGFKVKAAGG